MTVRLGFLVGLHKSRKESANLVMTPDSRRGLLTIFPENFSTFDVVLINETILIGLFILFVYLFVIGNLYYIFRNVTHTSDEN